MSRKLLQNMAGTHLVVSSIEVLEDISGSGIKTIKKDINALQNDSRKFEIKQENYWSNLSSDGVITPFEKKTILTEYKGIERSYAALFKQASDQNLAGTLEWQWYDEAFQELKNYLYNTINLFNDMDTDTVIPDRDIFDTKFSAYYYQEKYVTLALAMGFMGNLDFRTLSSLDEPGKEGEIGFYKGVIYQYTEGAWLAIGLEGYVGAKNSLPDAALNQYFIVSEEFKVSQQVIINGEELLINNDNFFVNQVFELGYIYTWDGAYWVKIEDKGDYRYVVAMVDLVTITGELPGVFQEAIDDASKKLQDEIDKANKKIDSNTDTIAKEIQDRQGDYTIINGRFVKIDGDIAALQEIASGAISHLPQYLGGSNTSGSLNPKEGDFFLYTGGTAGMWVNSDMYVFTSESWQHLDPSNPSVRNYYMMGLQDILASNKTGTGYFTQLFCQSFWANDATMNSLSTKEIIVRSGGSFHSEDWDGSKARGYYMDDKGNLISCGKTELLGDVTIGSAAKPANAYINGNGTFTGDLETNGNAIVHGTTQLDGDVTIGSAAKPANANINGTFNGNGTFTGNLETNGNAIVHGTTQLDGDVTIGSEAKPATVFINGNGSFSGDISAASGTFRGNIESVIEGYNGYKLDAERGTIQCDFLEINGIKGRYGEGESGVELQSRTNFSMPISRNYWRPITDIDSLLSATYEYASFVSLFARGRVGLRSVQSSGVSTEEIYFFYNYHSHDTFGLVTQYSSGVRTFTKNSNGQWESNGLIISWIEIYL